MLQRMILLSLTLVSISVNASSEVPGNDDHKAFSISFQSINRYARSTTDFERVDDSRSFTSEALFSESSGRLNRPLTEDERRDIIRIKEPIETFNNLRFSFGRKQAHVADVDLFYKYRKTDNAQITNFSVPNEFNDVSLKEYGMAIEKKFLSDRLLLRGAYKLGKREGVVERAPEQEEKLATYEVNGAISFFEGKHTTILYPTYVFQDIDPDVSNPPKRKRHIIAAGFAYGSEDNKDYKNHKQWRGDDTRPASSLDRIFERRYDPRSLRLYGGYVYDKETFGDVDVVKEDFFIGTSLGAFLPLEPFDLAVQPAIFSSEVEGDSSQDNAQYRTNVSLYYQSTEHLLFILPFRHDLAVNGPRDYENWRAGAELRYDMWPRNESTDSRKTAEFFMAVRYDHQDFYNLGRALDLISFYLRLGF